MHFESIKLFCDVAEQRSVSRAAELNGVTQSAASQRLMALERELGVQLIDRSTRPLRLTALGDQYHRGCRQILDRYRKLEQMVTSGRTTGSARSRVTVAAIYSAGIDLLNQVRHDFEAEQPGVEVEIHYDQPNRVHEAVRTGRADMGILSYPDRWRGVTTHPLRDEMMVVVSRAGHPLTGGSALSPGDLHGRDMVAFAAPLPIARCVGEYLREHGVVPNVLQTFDSIDTIKGYVADTEAVAILPDRTVRRELDSGVLARAALAPTLTRPLAVVMDRGREPTPTAEALLAYLLKHQPAPAPSPVGAAAKATA